VPQHILEHIPDLNGSTFESNPVGSGPYRLEQWERGNRIVLRANPTYFRGPPKLDRIEIDFVPDTNTLGFRVRTGELDFSPQLPQVAALQLRGDARLRFRAIPTYTALQFDFNTTAAPFVDARVRQAFALAVDRRRIAATSYHGLALPADDLVPPQSPFHVADASVAFGADARSAAALLDRAGWMLGSDALRHKDGATLATALMIPAGSSAVASAAVQVQAAWRALGIDATIRPLQSNTMLASNGPFARGDYGVALTTYGYATAPDRSQVLRSDAIAPNGRNYTRVDDPVLDRLVYAARNERDFSRSRTLYAKISKRVRHAAIFVPLLWLEIPYVYDAHFAGLRPEPINSDLWNAYDWAWK
jgi:peptide/nickel transport system substrate-binding protein